jgi:hypothetical protein
MAPATLALLLVGGCAAATEPWPVRDALGNAEPVSAEVAMSLLGAPLDTFETRVAAVEALDSDALLTLARAHDAARALAGHDSATALQVFSSDTEVVIGACDAPFDLANHGAGPEVRGDLPDELLGAVSAWLAACASPAVDLQNRVLAVSTDRLPSLVTYWADAGVVFVHPALVDAAESRGGTKQLGFDPPFPYDRALAGSGECSTAVLDYCATCSADGSGEGSGAVACEPLFSGSAEGCAELDALGVGREEAAQRYCAWLAVTHWPELRYFAQGCFISSETARDWVSLARAIPELWACPIEQCLNDRQIPSLPSDYGTFSYCVGKVEAFCDACAFETENPCPPLFADSTAVADCNDLRRGELRGNGEELYCASELLQEYQPGVEYCPEDRVRCIDELRFCMNAYDQCYWPNLVDFDRTIMGARSYESLVEAFVGYVNPETAADCQAQLEGCTTGRPHPEEVDFFQPPPTSAGVAGGEDKSCGN